MNSFIIAPHWVKALISVLVENYFQVFCSVGKSHDRSSAEVSHSGEDWWQQCGQHPQTDPAHQRKMAAAGGCIFCKVKTLSFAVQSLLKQMH